MSDYLKFYLLASTAKIITREAIRKTIPKFIEELQNRILEASREGLSMIMVLPEDVKRMTPDVVKAIQDCDFEVTRIPNTYSIEDIVISWKELDDNL